MTSRTPPWEDLCSDPFEGLPTHMWSVELHEANRWSEALVTQRCVDVLEALGVETHFDPAESAERLGIVPERLSSFLWLLRRLEASHAVERLEDGVVQAIEMPPEYVELLEKDPPEGVGPTRVLVDRAAKAWPDYLRGEIAGDAFFRRPDVLGLWKAYFANDHFAYAVINQQAAFALEQEVRSGDGGKWTVLELGGGFGSGAAALLERASDRIGTYRFSDAVPYFVQSARRELEGRFEGVNFEFERIDFNEPLAEQGVADASLDVCYMVNALHVARDLLATLGGIRKALKPGGTLVVGEAIRPKRDHPVPIEFVFQLDDGFRDVVLDKDFRPSGGFLHYRDWFAALERAGFESVRSVPDLDAAVAAYPTYSIGSFIAQRGQD